MAEKSAKKKPKKAADASVLGNLPATRPSRIGGERRGAAAPRKRTTGTATATKPKAKAKAKATAARKPASAPKAAEAKAAKLRKPDPAPPAGWQTPGEGSGGNGATDVVSTAVQAAGELAQLGFTLGGQLLRRAAGRIPRR
jgi:hypothetical protein